MERQVQMDNNAKNINKDKNKKIPDKTQTFQYSEWQR